MQNLLEKLGLGERATSMVVWVGLSLLLLIIVVALAVWLVRTLRPTLNMSGGSGRGGRPQRLAITDAFTLDRDGRKLVIVRRDNVEHLLLIGGPNDVLVESSIVRGERSNTRDRGGRGAPDNDSFPQEAPLAGDAPVAPQATIIATPPAPPPPVAQPVFRPTAPPVAKPAQPVAPRLDDDFERALSAMQSAQRQHAAAAPQQPVAPRAPQPAPVPPAPVPPPPVTAPAPPAPVPPPIPVMPEPPAAVIPPPPPPAPEPPPRAQPVSEMARRLNEVLQKPLSGTLRPPFNKPIPPVPGTMNSAPKPPAPPAEPEIAPPPPPAPPPVPQAPAPAAPPPVAGKPGSDHEMDLLEEEMARLLGRPSQPKKPDAT